MSCTDVTPAAAPAAASSPAAAAPVTAAAAPVASLPRINAPAPDFKAMTTHGPRSLADYRGKWLVLFSHPADFTPVCTTEFVAFAKAAPAFEALGCALLGLSIDSVFSHVAWVRNIKDKFGIEIPFPIIEDLSMRVANAFGMIHPGASDTSAVRATFVIDPNGTMRAMVYYPMSNGRNVAEILRLVKALQTSVAHGVATPEAWQPGDKVLVGPPSTTEAAEKRMHEGLETVDWYFSLKKIG
jgi:peroxiredoxin (alkyl hydroperoxide reductase subunit C)